MTKFRDLVKSRPTKSRRGPRLPANVIALRKTLAPVWKTLPEKKVENLALEWAKRELLKFCAAGSPWGPPGISPMSDAAGYAHLRFHLRLAALHSEVNRRQVIALARNGITEARTTLRDLVRELEIKGYALPDELADYRNEVFMLGHTVPSLQGEQAAKRDVRNFIIIIVMAGLLRNFPSISEFGHSDQQKNACEIMADALGVVGVRRGAKRVKDIWLKYGHSGAWMPT